MKHITALHDAHYQHCGKPVFYAQTLNHTREVEICIVTPSVAYSFGKTGAEHKAMDITVPVQMTGYAYQSNQIISLQGFTVRNGDTTYLASAGSDDESKPFAALDVYRGTPDTGKHLATLTLDPNTVVNDISHGLQNEGLSEQDGL
ncbi:MULTISPECIES: hypothetical protein [Klebsiella]|uniref:hypothetical protein n=1 Tax=Klebsiella TaxID=570 RepID=UPI00068ED3E6|nr:MULTISPECIES: hypothetical protein [Klebsiella]MDS7730094.1 hypothetical protein [Klebsiella oxytoca]MDS7804583.1 hypothetical protein [Klebsiella oxytoca]MDS7863103.1 hypothetical protein [Klebsiella oxytoca]OZS15407.1 hypothetical protein CIG58_29255 [Klebsiella oxytoca]PNO43220.1 hypothetical protein MC52_011945 [Klebsiella michiganensis]